MPDNDPLMTTAEIADWLRVNPKTITRWAHDGLIPYIKIMDSGRYRFRLADVQAALEANQPD